MTRRTTRRRFIQETTLAGLGFWAAGGVALARDSKSPNEKVNIACIGVGGKGSSDVDGAAKAGKIVALCDIDDNTLDKKAARLPRRPEVRRLPRDARQARRQDRRRHRQHAGPHARAGQPRWP